MAATATAEALAAEWWMGYRREAMSDDGDPEGFITHVRELADEAEPQSAVHQALALFLEQLRAEDLDADADWDDDEE